MDDSLTLDEISEHLTPHGRELLQQAIGSAQMVKTLRGELAKTRNQVPPAGEPDA
ncbi:hypothetical protein ABT341_00190 [Pseudonocardia alni]|uniref:hypothetical protein n=1 Tax=Pseudonocardia alni TaxID=33907 RepID=UPI003324D904